MNTFDPARVSGLVEPARGNNVRTYAQLSWYFAVRMTWSGCNLPGGITHVYLGQNGFTLLKPSRLRPIPLYAKRIPRDG